MGSEQPDRAKQNSERRKQEAIAWFTRINGEPSSADRKNFEQWRKSDPANELAYRNVVGSWATTDTLSYKAADADAAAVQGYLRLIKDARERRTRIKAVASVACVLLACSSSFFVWRDHPHLLENLTADYYTTRGERREIVLMDGSKVILDADSALSQKMDGELRYVHLLRGAAYFDVVKSQTPFVVDAGGGETRVTGTAFSVETSDDTTAVALERGSVTVTEKSGAHSAALVPGQGLTYSASGMSPVRAVLTDEVMSWREGRLIFDQARLGDVINHLGRYRPGRIVVIGDALAGRHVSGNLPLDDPESALSSLQATVGFRMTNVGSKLVVIGP
jgi:transmembrane sensor